MKKLRLLCIPPYEGMYHLMNNIAEQRSDVEMIIHMGNLDDGLKAVLENRDKSIDAIISRGGTAETIRRHVDIPSYDIVPSVYDVLRTIRLAQSTGEEFAVVGFSSVTQPASMLRDIMQYDYKVHPIHSAEECEQRLLQLREQGIRTIAGDMISVNCAKGFGMNGLLIVSGIESVEAAIDSVKEFYRHYGVLGKQASLLSDILRTDREATQVYSAAGKRIFSTEMELPGPVTAFLQKRFSTVIAQGGLSRVFHIKGELFTVRGRAIYSGGEDYCVYSIARKANYELIDKSGIRYLSADSELDNSNPLEYYLGNSVAGADLRSLCKRYAATTAPVLIEGEIGTGTDRFAHYIYSQSKQKHSSFLLIDAEAFDASAWEFLLKSDDSPLSSLGLSIYFRHINAAPAEYQRQLWLYLRSSAVRSNRLYFSYALDCGFSIQKDLYLYLCETIHCLRLVLLPLSQRREDIPSLAGLYINAVNVRLGTRVVGFTREAMLTLQNHRWERNIDQLAQTICDLVTQATSSFISDEQVQQVLSLDLMQPEDPREKKLDLERTLEEITRDIILRVYHEEKKNATKTANRLNISRSTLWRILKDEKASRQPLKSTE
ncbi:MAG: hypothetical protein E7442_03255 [Ruminococcaceae bacterium]|nr:hypothetical protein [Oscillospiraceae bacterium]